MEEFSLSPRVSRFLLPFSGQRMFFFFSFLLDLQVFNKHYIHTQGLCFFSCFLMDLDFIERQHRCASTKEEGEVISICSNHRNKILEECSLSLIGHFHTTKPINLRATKNLLRLVWKLGQDLRMTNVGNGLIQFKFSMESQVQWVLQNGSWSFDNHLLLLRRQDKGMTAFSVKFLSIPIWVQVWGLPFDLFNEEEGKDIWDEIGKVVVVNCKAMTSDQACLLRIRVGLLLDKPLRRGAPILSLEGDKVQVAFQYERLLGLCFQCGRLGHEAKDCSNPMAKGCTQKPYGEWMRIGFM